MKKKQHKVLGSSLSNSIGRITIGASSISLGLLSLAILCPLVPAETKAVDCTHGDTNPLCTTVYAAESEVGVQVASTISLALANKAEVDVVPHSGGNSFSETGVNLAVATNNPEGYGLYMNASILTDGEAKLTSGSSDNTATIDPIKGQAIKSELESNGSYANTWGYSLDGNTYQAVPASTTEIKKVTTTSFNDQHNISFGVAVNTSLPAGYYSNAVVVSAVANPLTLTLDRITYMQDMETPICDKTAVGVTKQLIDTRDQKKYWVAKLADNNCWMTQNLALDLSTDTPLTPESSDVSDEWVPSSNTETAIPNKQDNPPANTTRSWNLGNYVIAAPGIPIKCTITGAIGSNEPLSRCTTYIDVTSWSATLSAKDGVWSPANYTGLISVDLAAQTYDAHYLLGNYYQWNAATAGTGESTNQSNTNNDDAFSDVSKLIDATGSICPKGWQLPTSGLNSSVGAPYNRPKSFMQLLNAYKYPPERTEDWGLSANGNPFSMMNGAKQVLVMPPLYFVYGGTLRLDDGILSGVSTASSLWASTATPKSQFWSYGTQAINYGDDSWVYVHPTMTLTRYNGYPVRCIAR